MSHDSVWYSHPRTYGKAVRSWYVDVFILGLVDSVDIVQLPIFRADLCAHDCSWLIVLLTT